MRISDWSSDVCSSDLRVGQAKNLHLHRHCFQDHSSCHSFIKRVTSYLDFMSPVKPPTPLTVPPAWEAIAAAGFLAWYSPGPYISSTGRMSSGRFGSGIVPPIALTNSAKLCDSPGSPFESRCPHRERVTAKSEKT